MYKTTKAQADAALAAWNLWQLDIESAEREFDRKQVAFLAARSAMESAGDALDKVRDQPEAYDLMVGVLKGLPQASILEYRGTAYRLDGEMVDTIKAVSIYDLPAYLDSDESAAADSLATAATAEVAA